MSSPLFAIVASVIVVGLVAFFAYRTLLPARTATGSALALLTESFRRFLAASEGRHVEWAWDNGLLREYSAWAVALGEAEAWSAAVESSNIPHPEIALRGPLLLYTNSSAFRSRTPNRRAPAEAEVSAGAAAASAAEAVAAAPAAGDRYTWCQAPCVTVSRR